jgi:hypothetical protein
MVHQPESTSQFHNMTGIGLIVENKNNGLEEKISEYASCYDEAWQLASVIDCERFVVGYAEQLKYLGRVRAQYRSEEQNFTSLMNI